MLICILLPLFVVTELKGQLLMEGQMEVRNLVVSQQEGKLFISMDLDVSALKVSSNREVIFTPSLNKDDHRLELPSVMVAGRNRYYHHHGYRQTLS